MLEYSGVLDLPKWCGQNSHVTCQVPKNDGGALRACSEGFVCC